MVLDYDSIKLGIECTSFNYFLENVLEHHIYPELRKIVEYPIKYRYVLIVLPTGHLKTTTFTVGYSCWRLWKERGYEIGIVSSSLRQSQKFLSQIKSVLTHNKFFKHLIPKDARFDKRKWGASEIRTTNGNACYVMPFNSSARGFHPNLIIYDDLLREGDIAMDKIKEIFWSVFYPRGQAKNCRHLVVGTPIEQEDLYVDIESKTIDKGGEWVAIRKPAVNVDKDGNWVSSLWEERFPLEKLRQIKENMGSYRFNREYMCSTDYEEEWFFPRESILNACDDTLTFNHVTKGRVIIGADFAMSTSPTGDYNVFTVIDSINGTIKRKIKINGKIMDVEVKDPIIIKYIDRYKGATGQVSRLVDLYHAYRAERIVLDSSTFGARFAQELREQGVLVDAQDFRAIHRNQMLLNLRRIIETDDVIKKPPRLVIPTSQQNFTYSKTSVLIRELSGFRETKTPAKSVTFASVLDHDDTVMSLALAVSRVSKPAKQLKNIFYGA